MVPSLLFILLVSCSKNIRNEVEVRDEPMFQLENQLSELSKEVLGGEMTQSTRGFWSWIWNGVKKIGRTIGQDAVGFVDGFRNSNHHWTELDCWRDATHSAVDASFDAWQESSVRSTLTNENIQGFELYKSPYQTRLSKQFKNPYNIYGVVHNEAFINTAIIANQKKLTIEEMRFHLHKEAAIALAKYNLAPKGYNDERILDVIKWREEWKNKENNFTVLFRELYDEQKSLTTIDSQLANSSESEIRIMWQYLKTLSDINEEDKMIYYANEFSEIISESNISYEQKSQLLAFNAIATHSHALWKDVIIE